MHKHLFTPIYEGISGYAIGNDILLKKCAFPIKKSATTLRANLNPVLKAVGIR